MKKLINIIYSITIPSEPNQPIELNNINPEITAETIYEHTVIDEVYDKETKPESNDELITPLVTEPEIKPEQDSHKPKTINWIYVLCFICAIVIVICFVYGIRYLIKISKIVEELSEQNKLENGQKEHLEPSNEQIVEELSQQTVPANPSQKNESENSIVAIYMNIIEKNFHVCDKESSLFCFKKENIYIGKTVSFLINYYCDIKESFQATKEKQIDKKNFQEIIEIDPSKIVLNSVVFGYNRFFYEVFFLEQGTIQNISFFRSYSPKTDQQDIQKLNINIKNKEHLDKFMNYFIAKTERQIEENADKLIGIKDFTTFINTGLTFFPTMDQVKEWNPSK